LNLETNDCCSVERVEDLVFSQQQHRPRLPWLAFHPPYDAARLHPPSACPALLLVLPLTRFGQLAKNLPTDPTIFGLIFRSPQTLGVCGELMSNISATRGHPGMRICVCGNPGGDLSHIASLTLGCSRSDFSGANRRVLDHTCGG
jgi:hypothetical protein